MSKVSVEDVKRQSRHLRGTLAADLSASPSGMSEESQVLLKFHGSYQQENRDARKGPAREKSYDFMVRTKIPGGRMSAAQYLAHDELACSVAHATLRITSRQGLQLHGVVKGDLKSTLAAIHRSGLTTFGACGDVVRNVCAPAAPMADDIHRSLAELSSELSEALSSKSRAYAEVWLDGEPLDAPEQHESEPLYGEVYLPRKCKIGLAVMPRNDVDIYTHDIGIVPQVRGDGIVAYTVLVGGGLGMTHNKKETYPCLSQPLADVPRANVIEVVRALVCLFRDHGDRTDRKHARIKYLVRERGIAWVRETIRDYYAGPLEAPSPLAFDTVEDPLGWHEQGDGNWFYGLWVPDGRIVDGESGQYLAALRAVATELGLSMRLTANTNVLFANVRPKERSALESILGRYSLRGLQPLTRARAVSQACVALPTCGLALAEGERAFGPFMDQVDALLVELGLAREPLLIRMTGCPNGCARPYLADIAFVGRTANKYAVYVGGSVRGDHLGTLLAKTVAYSELLPLVRELLKEFVSGRQAGEPFGDHFRRTRGLPALREAESFHVELSMLTSQTRAGTQDPT